MSILDRFPTTKLNDINLDWILKKIRALRGGATGQILAKNSGRDFDFSWVDGSGSAVDYNTLQNRPEINNVVLSGNKTAADLGLLSNDTNINALGITGAVPGDVPRITNVDSNGTPTEWVPIPISNIMPRLNLLDNAYFGPGVINQRGETSLTGYGKYIIDRWLTSGYETTVTTIAASGITIQGNSSSGMSGIRQRLEKELPPGKYTMSALVAQAGTGEGVNFRLLQSDGTSIAAKSLAGTGLLSWTFSPSVPFRIAQFRSYPAVSEVTILAVKLESGSAQSLAFNTGTNDAPVWQLYDIPNPAMELLKCQRFFYRINVDSRNVLGAGLAWNAGYAYISIQVPVVMAAIPTLTFPGIILRLYQESLNSRIDIDPATSGSYDLDSTTNNNVYRLKINDSNSGLVPAKSVLVLLYGTGTVDFSAEIN